MDIDDLTIDNAYALGGSDDERERAEKAVLIEQLERRKRLKHMAVPTDDVKVRARLRAYGEPITLFGEGPGDRRDRLKLVQERVELARGGDTSGLLDESDESEEEEGEFFTEGPQALLHARRTIAAYSLRRARARIARQRIEVGLPLGRIVNVRKELFSELKTFQNLGSQFGDDRPLSTIRFSPNGKILLTTSWTGSSKLWDLPNLTERAVRRGHEDKVGGAAWHPQATVGASEDALNFVTGGGEGTIKLWSLADERPLATLSGHTNRVGRVAFHPSGTYLGSASFDGTWRLWDVETRQELLVQEGHSKEVYALAFQDDGALVSSGGFDGIGRVWDTRTGRTAMVLDGHVKEILAMDFAPNGFQVATGAGDDTVRIWDLRQLKTQYIIPAHKSSVSDVRFFRSAAEMPFGSLMNPVPLDMDGHANGADKVHGSGSANGVSSQEKGMEVDPAPAATNGTVNPAETDADARPPPSASAASAASTASTAGLPRSGLFLVTAGFDNNVRIWSADEWSMIRNLPTDSGKVMSVDVSGDGKFIASASYSRSFHLFGGDHSLS